MVWTHFSGCNPSNLVLLQSDSALPAQPVIPWGQAAESDGASAGALGRGQGAFSLRRFVSRNSAR